MAEEKPVVDPKNRRAGKSRTELSKSRTLAFSDAKDVAAQRGIIAHPDITEDTTIEPNEEHFPQVEQNVDYKPSDLEKQLNRPGLRPTFPQEEPEEVKAARRVLQPILDNTDNPVIRGNATEAIRNAVTTGYARLRQERWEAGRPKRELREAYGHVRAQIGREQALSKDPRFIEHNANRGSQLAGLEQEPMTGNYETDLANGVAYAKRWHEMASVPVTPTPGPAPVAEQRAAWAERTALQLPGLEEDLPRDVAKHDDAVELNKQKQEADAAERARVLKEAPNALMSQTVGTSHQLVRTPSGLAVRHFNGDNNIGTTPIGEDGVKVRDVIDDPAETQPTQPGSNRYVILKTSHYNAAGEHLGTVEEKKISSSKGELSNRPTAEDQKRYEKTMQEMATQRAAEESARQAKAEELAPHQQRHAERLAQLYVQYGGTPTAQGRAIRGRHDGATLLSKSRSWYYDTLAKAQKTWRITHGGEAHPSEFTGREVPLTEETTGLSSAELAKAPKEPTYQEHSEGVLKSQSDLALLEWHGQREEAKHRVVDDMRKNIIATVSGAQPPALGVDWRSKLQEFGGRPKPE